MAAFESSMATNDCIPGLKRLTIAVQDREAKIAVQLYNTGWENARFLKTKGEQARVPSFIPNDPICRG